MEEELVSKLKYTSVISRYISVQKKDDTVD